MGRSCFLQSRRSEGSYRCVTAHAKRSAIDNRRLMLFDMRFSLRSELRKDVRLRYSHGFPRLPHSRPVHAPGCSFASAAPIRNQEALDRIVQPPAPSLDDTVLDVACGPGLLACAFARVAKHATGIDMTPAMLEQARKTQQEQGLKNVSWEPGDVYSLPFPDAQFSIVSSRFVFHHLQDPLAALKEMKRVCKPGGRMVVADMAPQPAKADALNAAERLRDPSHVRALPKQSLARCLAEPACPHRRFRTIAWKANWKSCSPGRSRTKAMPTACGRSLPIPLPTTLWASTPAGKMEKSITAFRWR